VKTKEELLQNMEELERRRDYYILALAKRDLR
jgi:hypothetical protein